MIFKFLGVSDSVISFLIAHIKLNMQSYLILVEVLNTLIHDIIPYSALKVLLKESII